MGNEHLLVCRNMDGGPVVHTRLIGCSVPVERMENQHHSMDTIFHRSDFFPSDDRLDIDGYDCRIGRL